MTFFDGCSLRVRAAAVLCTVAFSCALVPGMASAQLRDASAVGRYADALGDANARLPIAARRDLAERLLLLSSYYKLDPCLLAAVVSVESSWRANAVSPVGALGYGQLMPGTAAGLAVDALEPYENLDGTARYLRRMLMRYQTTSVQTRMRLALASYNAGPAAVTRYHGVPPYRETRSYVDNVLRTRAAFAAAVRTRARPAVAANVPTVHQKRAAQRVVVRPKAVAPTRHLVLAPVVPAAQYERSHSFFARMLGLRHRVPSPATVAAKDPAPAGEAVVLPP